MPRTRKPLTEYAKQIRRWARAFNKTVKPPLNDDLEAMAERMRRRVPVDKGTLRDAVAVVKAKSRNQRIKGEVRVQTGHANLVEYGSIHNSPTPFIRPAAVDTLPEIKKTGLKAIKKAFDSIGVGD